VTVLPSSEPIFHTEQSSDAWHSPKVEWTPSASCIIEVSASVFDSAALLTPQPVHGCLTTILDNSCIQTSTPLVDSPAGMTSTILDRYMYIPVNCSETSPGVLGCRRNLARMTSTSDVTSSIDANQLTCIPGQGFKLSPSSLKQEYLSDTPVAVDEDSTRLVKLFHCRNI